MHLGLKGNYSGFHPAIACDADRGFVAAIYRNSERRASIFAGWKLRHGPNWLEAGIVTGYTTTDVLPMLRIGVDISDQLAVFAAPAAELDGLGHLRPGLIVGLQVSLP